MSIYKQTLHLYAARKEFTKCKSIIKQLLDDLFGYNDELNVQYEICKYYHIDIKHTGILLFSLTASLTDFII